jgi:hypothetical protein
MTMRKIYFKGKGAEAAKGTNMPQSVFMLTCSLMFDTWLLRLEEYA